MGYFLPSFLQKRLLRYAISRLELIDTDALELDKLDIAWGQRSTLELRDVGLKLEKLARLLQLPAAFELTKARILLLRLTIPADIYSSGIVVEVEGVIVRLRLPPDNADGRTLLQKGGISKGNKADRPRSTPPSVHDPGGKGSKYKQSTRADDGPAVLPSTADLAQSFLQSEPKEEREELEAAIASQSQYGQQSISSSDDDEEFGAGAEGISLPSFVAGFFKGVEDRLQVKIKNVTFSVDMDILPDVESKKNSSDSITTQLSVEHVTIDGVTTLTDGELSKSGKRLISLENVQVMLMADPLTFSKYSAVSTPASPVVTQSKSAADSRAPSSPSKSNSSMSSSAALAMTRSTIFDRAPNLGDTHPALESSVYSSDGRFSDAGTDLEEGAARSVGGVSALESSQYQDSVLDNPSYLDSVLDQVEDDDMDDSVASHPAGHLSPAQSARPYTSPRNLSGFQDDERDGSSSSSGSPSPGKRPTLSTAPSYASVDNRTNAITKTVSDPERSIEPSMLLPVTMGDLSSRPNSPHSVNSAGSQHSSFQGEDLAESKIFTHEEAESMYMSAVSHASEAQSRDLRIPGAWDESSSSGGSPRIQPPTSIPSSSSDPANHRLNLDEVLDERCSTPTPRGPSTFSMEDESPSTPTRSTIKSDKPETSPKSTERDIGSNSSSTSEKLSRLVKPIMTIDSISLWLPSDEQPKQDFAAETARESLRTGMKGHRSSSQALPSDQEILSSSRTFVSERSGKTSDSDAKPPVDNQNDNCDGPESLLINISTVAAQFDLSIGWLITRMFQKMAKSMSPSTSSEPQGRSEASPVAMPLKLSLGKLSLSFLDHLRGQDYPLSALADLAQVTPLAPESDVLLKTTVVDLRVSRSVLKGTSKFRLDISKFLLGFASDQILSFDAGLKMRESTRDMLSPNSGDISLTITSSDGSSHVSITTLPLLLSINIQKADEMLGWFGGLSGILELGSSIASASTIMGSGAPKAIKSPKKTRGVHFEQSPGPISPAGGDLPTPAKANVRVGGLVVDVIGKECSVALETTAVKIINRPEITAIQVDKAKLSGPHLPGLDGEPSVIVDVSNTRVEHLFTPQEQDLDKLLSLLTPSKSKYGHDDDIMLDTLFRQRRQGPVLRVNVERVKTAAVYSADLSLLPRLALEATALGKVAKYLPEDDRPGLMTLAKIKDLDANFIMQGLIGSLNLKAQGIGAAHVNIPSLMAFKSTLATLTRNGSEELVKSLPPPSGAKLELPMLMARFIADEMDPVLKIKLFNAQVEYTVPAVMAVMGLTENMTAEDVAINMAASVINLAEHHHSSPTKKATSQSSSSSEGSVESPTDFKFACSIHNSVIGLNPRDLPSKSLFVLTDAGFAGNLRKDNDFEAKIDIKKASIMVIDDVKNIVGPPDTSKRSSTRGDQLDIFRDLGFIPVGYISSAQAIIKTMKLNEDTDKSLDVEIRDDLFVLETCADSTQTLLSVVNGLSPPSPPAKVMKYRTEVMPIQDLLASMTGDAFVTNQATDGDDFVIPEAIQEEPEEESGATGSIDFDIESNYYGTEAGDSTGDLSASTVGQNMDESGGLPEPSSRKLRSGQDVMPESLHAEIQEPMTMSALDFKEDHFASKSSVGGTAHRWNSSQNTYSLANEVNLRGSPIRLRVRDVHFIWNLFDGYDWQRTRDTISKVVKDVEVRANERRRSTRRVSRDLDEDEESVIGDFLFNSIYIGIPANRDPRELANNINREIDDLTSEAESYATTITADSPSRQSQQPRSRGKKLRLQRSKQHKMTFELEGISADLVVFPPDSGETQSSLDVRIDNVEIFDHVPTSTWKKFATYMHDAGEKESGTSMVHLEMLSVKPIPELAASELILKVSVLPLRLHVDQDALDFMSRFFEFKDDSIPIHTSTTDVPFVQRAEVNSVRVRLDFKPKRVDYGGLRSGRTTEFMNFFILQEADMVLRHVIIYGISGFDKLGKTLNDIWMPDVKQNQLPSVLAGLAPVRSLVNVGSGVKDLVVIPMREYKKDGRVVRSIQKGAVAFAKTTTTELAKLGAKLAVGTQTVLQGAEDFLNRPNVPDVRWDDAELDEDEKKQISLYADQPVGVVQGLRGAYSMLERDLVTAKDAIVAVPGEVVESGSATGAAKAVLRRAPTVILRPAIGATKAVGQTLMGATNSLDPTNRRRVDDKYKKH